MEQRSLTFFEKSEESKDIIRRSLEQHYLFESLGDSDLDKIVACMKPVQYGKNDIIICEGDDGDQFFVIECGQAVASVLGQGVVATYGSGGCFGELALIFNCPRAASVVAQEPVVAWTIDLR